MSPLRARPCRLMPGRVDIVKGRNRCREIGQHFACSTRCVRQQGAIHRAGHDPPQSRLRRNQITMAKVIFFNRLPGRGLTYGPTILRPLRVRTSLRLLRGRPQAVLRLRNGAKGGYR